MSGSLNAGFTASQPSRLSKALQTTVLCPTFVANLLGNICVCLAVTRVRSLSQRPSSSILASLAVSDLSVLSFLLFRLIWLYDLEAASKVCENFFVVLAALVYVSIAHICFFSCDRYVAIVYPLRYTEIVTKRRVKRAVALAWCAPVVSMAVLSLMYPRSGRTLYRTSLLGCSESQLEPSALHKVHLAFNLIFFVAIPFVVMIFVYGRIAMISWYQNNRLDPGENLNPQMAEMKRKKRKEMKWMKTIVMVIGAFALCYLPGCVCLVLTAKLGPSRVPIALRSSFVLMAAINSALNPIIYMFRSKEFKRAFRKVFRRASILPQIENNTTVHTGLSRLETTVSSPRNVPNENATFPSPRLEGSAMASAGSDSSVETSEEIQTAPFSVVMFTYGQKNVPPSSLAVPVENITSPELNKIKNFFDSRSDLVTSLSPSCLASSTWGRNERSLSFLGVQNENEGTPETRSEVSMTTNERSLNSIEVRARGEEVGPPVK